MLTLTTHHKIEVMNDSFSDYILKVVYETKEEAMKASDIFKDEEFFALVITNTKTGWKQPGWGIGMAPWAEDIKEEVKSSKSKPCYCQDAQTWCTCLEGACDSCSCSQ